MSDDNTTTTSTSSTSWIEQVEEWKRKGNDAFSKNDTTQAISYYSQGIVICDHHRHDMTESTVLVLKITLLSNRAMCYLKNNQYQECIDDCTNGLEYLKTLTDQAVESLRSKLLFRRGKAYFMQSNMPASSLPKQPVELLNDSAKDLLLVIQMDSNNKDANQLLSTVRLKHKQITAMTSQTPVSKTLASIIDYTNQLSTSTSDTSTNNIIAQCLHQIKLLLGLLENDIHNVSMELGRLNGIISLLHTSKTFLQYNNTTELDSITITNLHKIIILSIRCISHSSCYPIFVRTFLINYQKDIYEYMNIVATSSIVDIKTISDCIVVIISCYVRFILHIDRDDINIDIISSNTKQDYQYIIKSINISLQLCLNHYETINKDNNNDIIIISYETDIILRALYDMIATWATCSTDRENNIRIALQSSGNINDSTIPIPKTAMDIHQMTPKELAIYRKRQNDTKKRDIEWSTSRCQLLIDEKVFDKLLTASCLTYNHIVRREGIIMIGRIIAIFNNDEKVKSIALPYLQNIKTTKNNNNGPMIEEIIDEEIDDEDGIVVEDVIEEEMKDDAIIISTLEKKMEHCMVSCAMLLTTNKEIGAWSLSTGWDNSITDISDMIISDDIRALCLSAELISAASTNEHTRTIITSFISPDHIDILLQHHDRDIRSSAASAVAKLGLAANAANKGITNDNQESELMTMLSGACELLLDHQRNKEEENGNEETKNNNDYDSKLRNTSSSTSKINHFSSYATSSVERGVEMLTYLMSNTMIKEEICSDFIPSSKIISIQDNNTNNKKQQKDITVFELLVDIAITTPNIAESLTGYGLASIFRNLSITNEDIRKLMFEDKDVTMEQYDEMQKLQKTDEEKELLDNDNDINKDIDNTTLCNARIQYMCQYNVCRALVTLIDTNTTEHTLEQIALCLCQISNVIPVRGIMIQHGILTSCIKVETKEGPTITDTMKSIIRMFRHTIAKLLITTNPNMLTLTQRLGCIQPLLRLIRDIKGKDIQHFEALMALTNIASSGDDAIQRIITERGIPALHYAMFDNHTMVRRAATESMCNLVSHPEMIKHLQQYDTIRLWLSFAEDYENNDGENYECSRAAAGGIAMATQHNYILCNILVQLPRFEEQILCMLESGRLELMHRTFCIIFNILEVQQPNKADEKEQETNNELEEIDEEDNKKDPKAKIIFKNINVKDKLVEGTKIILFCRAYIENYIKNGVDGLGEFPPNEKQLLPVVLDLAKKIVLLSD